MKVIRSLIKQE